eukprot:TRINITY_DN14254_c0_g1_i2.p1 TRINITY_DN14254_c0_g1~~TRINITY_DN14254_c0_g1_i2.p1  ORF type:complete len:714 (-),score=154.78 TRINITY_DN14254_c0_g1_i2:100-2241(-)
MGFRERSAVAALLQAEEEDRDSAGSSGLFERALAMLVDQAAREEREQEQVARFSAAHARDSSRQRSSGGRNRGRGGGGGASRAPSSLRPVGGGGIADSRADADMCTRCGTRQPVGSFCGGCGQRLRAGGPGGAADAPSGPEAAGQAFGDLDDDGAAEVPVVTAWPEVYDASEGCWVAVDLVFDFLAKEPVIEWAHRGTPMLWVLAADDALRGEGDPSRCILRDVTPRYSPCWWRVEQARGSRQMLRWWDDALRQLSGDAWEKLPENVDGAEATARTRAQSFAAEADDLDTACLRQRRLSGGVPTTRAALKSHAVYVLESDLRPWEVIRPEAKAVAIVSASRVYLRKHVATARSLQQWRKLGFAIREGEAPCAEARRTKAALFAEWQTVAAPAAASATRSKAERPPKLRRLRWKAPPSSTAAGGQGKKRRRKASAEEGEIGFPQLKAPKKQRRKTFPGFEKGLAELREWLEARGCLPWEKSGDSAERRLAAWVRKVWAARGLGRLSTAQRRTLEELEGWSWGSAPEAPEEAEDDDADGGDGEPATAGAAAGGGADGGSASASAAGQAGRKRPRGGAGEAPPAEAAAAASSGEADDWLHKWLQCTLQRLQADFSRQPDATARRLRLRQWQRDYHPDKNPGRAHEVLPIFRWVQARWEEQFRGSESGGAAGSQAAGNGADGAAAAAAAGKPAPPAAKPEVRRRVARKSRPSNFPAG